MKLEARGDAIEITDLGVRYGRTRALENVSLSVPEGSVYALLGRNGAGKSSLIRCLLGHQRATDGVLSMLGRSPWEDRASLMAEVGCVAETPDPPPHLSSRRIGRLCARLNEGWSEERFVADLERLEIDLSTPFENLSRGQRALVSITIALVGEPRLLVLDDPTLGLDPVARRSVFEGLITDLAERETTVFLATHDLDGVERVADRVAVLHSGRLLVDEPLEKLKGRFRRFAFDQAPDDFPHRVFLRTPTSLGVELIIDDLDAPEREEGAAMSLEEIFVALVTAAGNSREVVS